MVERAEAVVFDLDGVLLDSARLFMRALDYAGQKVGIGYAGHILYKTWGQSEQASMAAMRRVFGSRYDVNALYNHFLYYLSHFLCNQKIPLKPGVNTLLRYLRSQGYRLAVATLFSRGYAEQYLKKNDLLHMFDVIVYGDQIDDVCCDGRLHLEACRQMNTSPEDTVAVDDTPCGITGASKAGLTPIMVPDLLGPDKRVEKLLYARCESLYELLALFRDEQDLIFVAPVRERMPIRKNA